MVALQFAKDGDFGQIFCNATATGVLITIWTCLLLLLVCLVYQEALVYINVFTVMNHIEGYYSIRRIV